jgi:hypothetical protein
MAMHINQKLSAFLFSALKYIFPDKDGGLCALKNFAFILIGGLFISPLVGKLPLLGYDWYYFFNSHNPNFNITTVNAYPPFTQYFILPLTKLDWRISLSIINSFTIVSIALLTYQGQKKYLPIILALINLPVFFLLFDGQIDGLTLLGVASGFIPFILIKPQVAIWSIFQNKRWVLWTAIILIISLFVWPMWPLYFKNALVFHPADYGWYILGWPIGLIGFLMLIGAGNDPFRLMAAGCLITPYLMPYNMAILVPIIGRAKGYRPFFIWAASWLMFLGVGLGGYYRYLNFVFPLTGYWLTQNYKDYWLNVKDLWRRISQPIAKFHTAIFYAFLQN